MVHFIQLKHSDFVTNSYGESWDSSGEKHESLSRTIESQLKKKTRNYMNRQDTSTNKYVQINQSIFATYGMHAMNCFASEDFYSSGTQR